MERLWRLLEYKGTIPQGTRLRVAKRTPGWFAFHQAVRINQALGDRAAVGARSRGRMGERPLRQLWT
jgi:hypothetical protein